MVCSECPLFSSQASTFYNYYDRIVQHWQTSEKLLYAFQTDLLNRIFKEFHNQKKKWEIKLSYMFCDIAFPN